MDRITISQFNMPEIHRYAVSINDTFTIKPKAGRLSKITYKLLFWLLSKLCKVKPYEEWKKEVNVKTVEIDLSNIEKMLLEHLDSIQCIYHRECRMIVIGHREMAKLRIESHDPLSFNFPPDYCSNTAYGDSRLDFRGIEVVCVPWIDGAFAIPK